MYVVMRSSFISALTPSLLLRKRYFSLRELFQSQRDKHCSRSERGLIR